MGLKDSCQEVASSRPLFLTIYTTVIVGIVLSSLYVFSAVYSADKSSPDSTSWLSSSPSLSCDLSLSLCAISSLVLIASSRACRRRCGLLCEWCRLLFYLVVCGGFEVVIRECWRFFWQLVSLCKFSASSSSLAVL